MSSSWSDLIHDMQNVIRAMVLHDDRASAWALMMTCKDECARSRLRPPAQPNLTQHIMARAARSNHVALLTWWPQWNTRVIDEARYGAIQCGSLDALKWIYARYGKGEMDVLRFSDWETYFRAMYDGSGYSPSMYDTAIKWSRVAVLDWLLAEVGVPPYDARRLYFNAFGDCGTCMCSYEVICCLERHAIAPPDRVYAEMIRRCLHFNSHTRPLLRAWFDANYPEESAKVPDTL